MPRVVGVDLPKEKRIDIALMYIYGIGRSLSKKILSDIAIDPSIRAKDLTEEQVQKIATAIQQGYKVEGDLRREVSSNIKRLMEISAYRGFRHRRGLPVRGQRTSTNARTRKGPRRMIGVRKKTTSGPSQAPAKAAGK